MQLGIIGLDKIGGNLGVQARKEKIDVIGKARSRKPELEKERSQGDDRLTMLLFHI